ncbi:hypothetical protein [Streptomyces sp. NPDC048650]|uniref:hypothetical protein n=1 Tax=unclassified Streptomyces TaxID=2593676 RepID=UPI00370FE7E6
MPDSLARLADGLADQACRRRLARLTMGPPGHPGLDGAQVVTATGYRPYGSPGIPSSPDGDRLCAEFMDALLSDEVTKSIQESGPMAILAATDAIRQILAGPDNPVGDPLAALAAAIPTSEGQERATGGAQDRPRPQPGVRRFSVLAGESRDHAVAPTETGRS